MLEEQVLTEIANALEINRDLLSPTTVNTDIQEWDSLGHITILARLDELFNNISERFPQLAEASSIPEILLILQRDGQL